MSNHPRKNYLVTIGVKEVRSTKIVEHERLVESVVGIGALSTYGDNFHIVHSDGTVEWVPPHRVQYVRAEEIIQEEESDEEGQ